MSGLLVKAMQVQTQAQADEIFRALVVLIMQDIGESEEEATRSARHDLGYFAGYYDDETRERVERLFQCEHPFFGSIAKNGPPTPKEAFEAGIAYGEWVRRRIQERDDAHGS